MRSEPRGFVLPTTLMVMTLLTVMLTAAFILVSAEFRTTDNSLAMNRASALAQTGLQDYLSRNRGINIAASYDSLRITYAAGYADVVGTRMVAANGAKVPLWLVRSTGVITGGALSGQTQAQGVVAQLAQLNTGVLPLKGAFVAGNPIVITGSGFAPITGNDACAAALDTVDVVAAAADVSGLTTGMTIRNFASRAAVLDSTHIDWAALLAGDFTPDITLGSWSGSIAWPIVYAPGNYTLSGNHVGILVVSGDLKILLGASFQGIILVGGHLVAPAFSFVFLHGSVVTGLNNLTTPGSAGNDTIPRGWPGFQWNSCSVNSAVNGMISMSPLKHAFIDTWSTY